jgi:hypothetical protein
VRVIGNCFSSDCRNLLQILDIGRVEYQFEPIENIFSFEGCKKLKEVNPAEINPTLIHNGKTIIADGFTLCKYALKTNLIKNQYYPTNDTQSNDSILRAQ